MMYFTLKGFSVARFDNEVLIYYTTPYQLDYLLRHKKQLCDRYPNATITVVGEQRVQIQP
jgi:hypothetical protein